MMQKRGMRDQNNIDQTVNEAAELLNDGSNKPVKVWVLWNDWGKVHLIIAESATGGYEQLVDLPYGMSRDEIAAAINEKLA